jgi:alkylhydroperoxidase family enzyme
MACHAEFLRVALENDEKLPRAVLADPATAVDACATPRQRALIELVTAVTNAPWSLTRAHRARANEAGLDDDDVLHAIALTSYFGHLNRIADATGVPLDYEVRIAGRHADATTPPLPTAPEPIVGRPALELSRRPATANAIGEWRSYLIQKDEPLTRRQRTLITRFVASWLGDGGISPPQDLTANPLDGGLRALAEIITLAPWQLSEASFEALRSEGFDDAKLFDVCATASAAGVFSRIEVALVALAS